jgi:hypothetical protein
MANMININTTDHIHGSEDLVNNDLLHNEVCTRISYSNLFDPT